jgi:hypothetical protein
MGFDSFLEPDIAFCKMVPETKQFKKNAKSADIYGTQTPGNQRQWGLSATLRTENGGS